MEVRLLTGVFVSVEGSAINDFEDLVDGPVTDLRPGATEKGDCRFLETVFIQR